MACVAAGEDISAGHSLHTRAQMGAVGSLWQPLATRTASHPLGVALHSGSGSLSLPASIPLSLGLLIQLRSVAAHSRFLLCRQHPLSNSCVELIPAWNYRGRVPSWGK